jgi:hypothetical protein
MSSLKKFFLYACLLLTFVFSPAAHPQDTHQRATTIFVEKTAGRASYEVNAKHVDDLLLALNQIFARNGSGHPVIVLVDSRLPAAEIWNVDGVAGKAQLTNLRFFIAFRESEMMSEIKRMPAVRLSTTRDGDSLK